MQYVDLTKTVENHRQKKATEKKKAQDRSKKSGMLASAAVLIIVILALVFGKNVGALFTPVSIVSNVIGPNLKSTDGRTNILVLGVDRRSVGKEGGVLTDTLLFASVDDNDGSVAMISLPRDLWVKADAGKGTHYMKINAVYAVDGVDELLKVTEDVLGMPVHYYSVVDFNLFKESIDTLGGVEVEVDKAFVDTQYPIEGKEAETCGRTEEEIEKLVEEDLAENVIYPCRYQTVSFEAGKQLMDGETALKYVRSRKGTNEENTDFARSHRQQKVIMAIKDKALNLETILDLGKIRNLYDTYSKNVDTNIAFDDVQGFWSLSQKINFNSVRSIVLDDRSVAEQGGILYSPTDTSLYGGAYILLPKSGDYSQIRAYVQKYIFGE